MAVPPQLLADALAASGLLVASAALQRTVDDAARVATSSCHVLVLGERGVGKEGLARFVHVASGRSGSLIAVNCATIQPALAESTLFLDEVGELPLEVQARLLRLLQEGVVQPVGELERRVDVRIVAATNRDLDRAVAEGRFREDLRDRLHQVGLRLPPLRERRAEIVPLAERFLEEAPELAHRPRRSLAKGARAALRAHDWPGNVRELRNAILSAALLSDHEVLTARDVRRAITSGPGGQEPEPPPVERGAGWVEALDPDRTYALSELLPVLGRPRGTVKRWVAEAVARGALVSEGASRGCRYRLPREKDETAEAGGPGEAVVERLRQAGSASTGELVRALGLSRATVKRLVHGLCVAGRAERFGAGSEQRVRLVGASEGVKVEGAGDARTSPPVAAQDQPPVVPEPPAPESNPTETRLADQEAMALRLVRREGATTARALAAALGQHVRTAERVLARLSDQGRLRPEGYARARRYLQAEVEAAQRQLGEATEAPKRTARARPEANPRPPAVAVNGRPLPVGLLRQALALAAAPEGVGLSDLTTSGRVDAVEARRLLHSLVGAGLLSAQPGWPARWRLRLDAPGARDTA